MMLGSYLGSQMKLRKVYRFWIAGVLPAVLFGVFSGSPQPSLADDAKPKEAKKIPAAPAAEVEIKELKTTLAVDVLAQHSKVFKTKQKITRVAVSDPSVADVILMTENQFVVIGKNPGAISVTIWCEPDKKGSM
jgi:Flp pilus assembly secretin CpaC